MAETTDCNPCHVHILTNFTVHRVWQNELDLRFVKVIKTNLIIDQTPKL